MTTALPEAEDAHRDELAGDLRVGVDASQHRFMAALVRGGSSRIVAR
jgi:hypothetical protein